MSIPKFCAKIGSAQLGVSDKKWMPRWLAEFRSFYRPQDENCDFELTTERVLEFLRSLRDRGIPAWQRLQAARALEWYQKLVLNESKVDFSPFQLKLIELADKERRSGGDGTSSSEGRPGEGQPGLLDPTEPKAVCQFNAVASRLRKDIANFFLGLRRGMAKAEKPAQVNPVKPGG